MDIYKLLKNTILIDDIIFIIENYINYCSICKKHCELDPQNQLKFKFKID